MKRTDAEIKSIVKDVVDLVWQGNEFNPDEIIKLSQKHHISIDKIKHMINNIDKLVSVA